MTTTPEPDIVPGTSRPIPADPDASPLQEPEIVPPVDPEPASAP